MLEVRCGSTLNSDGCHGERKTFPLKLRWVSIALFENPYEAAPSLLG